MKECITPGILRETREPCTTFFKESRWSGLTKRPVRYLAASEDGFALTAKRLAILIS